MFRSSRALVLGAGVLFLMPSLLACSDDDDRRADAAGGTAGSGGTGGTGGTAGTAGSAGSAGSGGSAATRFELAIENRSGASALPTPLSPGVWALHQSPDLLFIPGMPDAGMGLEPLAEDGMPGLFAANLSALSGVTTGTFDTPIDAPSAAPAMPGQSYRVEIEARPGEMLSVATMFAQSNDVVLSTAGSGIPLFDETGAPLPARDVTGLFALWDAGTEKNEAPGFGLAQAPRQAMANFGPAEGVVSLRTEPTRALPIPAGLLDVSVTEQDGTFTIEIENVSAMRGVATTPLSPVFYALHTDEVAIYGPGGVASPGLEALAEDGNAPMWAAEQSLTPGVSEASSAGSGPFMPGESVTLSVRPTPGAHHLSLASMVAQTNDVFVATPPNGIALLDAEGAPRPAAQVRADLLGTLALWDAGTEANEVPGVGMNQAPRQPAPDTGPADPVPMIRQYMDTTHDLMAPALADFVNVEIVHTGGTSFTVTIENVSGDSAFPGLVSPAVWAVHSDAAQIFTDGQAASAGLEALAEDGMGTTLMAELAAKAGVSMTGIAGSMPIAPGSSVSFGVTASPTHRFLNFATMAVPSNDTFLALGEHGVELLDAAGSPRSSSEISGSVTALLGAWESGTEHNQASAIGPDMAGPGLQSGPNTGASEGDGSVRSVESDLWPFPASVQIARITITPLTE